MEEDSQATHSQIVQMQKTINLASDTSSEAPTKKRSKGSNKDTDQEDKETPAQASHNTGKEILKSNFNYRYFKNSEEEQDI